MKRAFALVLAVTLFFSFAVVGFAELYPEKYRPHLYYSMVLNESPTVTSGYTLINQGAQVDTVGLTYEQFVFSSQSIRFSEILAPYSGVNFNTPSLYFWIVTDITLQTPSVNDVTDIGNVLYSYIGGSKWADVNVYKTYISENGEGRYVMQSLVGLPGNRGAIQVAITYMGTFPQDTVVVTNDMFYQYSDTYNDQQAPPLDPDNPYPSEPDGPMSPPTESDQWVSEQYSGAVNPDLAPKIEEAYSAAETVDTFEQDMWSELDKYSADVNPDNFTFDPQFVSSMGWIASTWTDAFNGLGSWQSIITFPMFLGLAMLIIGRGSQAIDRGVAKVQRRQMRDEYRWNRSVDDA